MNRGLVLIGQPPYLGTMGFFSRFSPLRAIADLRFFLSHRQPYELGFLALSVLVVGLLIAGFVHDSHEERPYKREIVYVQQWPLTRTDAEIHAQQKIDGVEQTRLIAEENKRRAALRAQFKRLDDKLKAYGL